MSLFVTRSARRAIMIDPVPVDGRGRLTIHDFSTARKIALGLSRPEEGRAEGGDAVAAGDVVALSLLDDVFRLILGRYSSERDQDLLPRLVRHLSEKLGYEVTVSELGRFREAFGLGLVTDVAMTEAPAGAPAAIDDGLVLDLLLLWLQRRNPAARRIVGRLHRGFEPSSEISRIFDEIGRFLATCSGLKSETLASDLLAPIEAHPDSLAGQLTFLQRVWADVLGEDLWRLQSALDLIAEETAPRWGGGGAPPAAAPVLSMDGDVRYAADRDWMPRLVLLAKNTLVWLHQISNAYGRDVTRLDQVPERELELVAGRGFTGLWLIGLWERSPASSEIKRRRGNPEAASSAYSLQGYRIAEEFGGEEALETLRQRAARHGVRLAADMVPNHMGIDSDWVLDHPERFVQVRKPPFPAYSFNGPDLSPRADLGIYLEDHYYDGTDAAVVFKRVDRTSGEETFIYHGNDGTSMPWNDTAQLDYLQIEVREAVIRTILDVAKKFSVIRFDAAMTLAKRHYHRLWHPSPGDAGAIPSRSEHGLTREEMDRRMPREFWREVVDRVSNEAPDTLLLAEAFWLMEGYFVRTLGLHRVYNSAFMHMMRDGETGEYRRLLKETLAFDPEILRRYVNFMSNPDEESAANQFDLGDRYFGVCTVLATLPGLPMFGHGQWDGLREKYGMEYRRSYRDEEPRREVIERHDREIAPLLRRRSRFAGVSDFRLYDLVGESGTVHEDVLAYSNGCGSEASLVLFNNSSNPVRGRISQSAPHRGTADQEGLLTEWVGDALPLSSSEGTVAVLRDRVHGVTLLSTIGRGRETDLTVEIGSYGAAVFDRFETLEDREGAWSNLARHLQGRPVIDVDAEMAVFRAPVLTTAISSFADMLAGELDSEESDADAEAGLDVSAGELDDRLVEFFSGPPFRSQEDSGARRSFAAVVAERALERRAHADSGSSERFAEDEVLRYAAAFLPVLEGLRGVGEDGAVGAAVLDSLVFGMPIDHHAQLDLLAVLVLAGREGWIDGWQPPGIGDLASIVDAWSRDDDARRILGAHESGGVEWIVGERLERLLAVRVLVAELVIPGGDDDGSRVDAAMSRTGWRLAAEALRRTVNSAGFRFERWRESLHALAAKMGAGLAEGESRRQNPS
jgi:glycosidase